MMLPVCIIMQKVVTKHRGPFHFFRYGNLALHSTRNRSILRLQRGHNFFRYGNHKKNNQETIREASFKGAITFSLWKFLCRHVLFKNIFILLQRGHNFFVMEICTRFQKIICQSWASKGP